MLSIFVAGILCAEPAVAPPPPPPPTGPAFDATPPPPPPPESSTADPSPLHAGPPWVHVTLRAPDGVRLGRLPTRSENVSMARYMFAGDRPQRVCTSPCGVLIGRGDDDFLVEGEGIPDSATFHLDRAPRVTIDVRTGTAALKPVGILSIVFGSIGIVTGGIATLIGYAARADNVFVGGAAVLGTGAVLLVGGIVAIVFSRTVARIIEG